MGILEAVKDEGHFWENRDVKALAETVGQRNRHVAGIVGQFKDQIGGEIVAPLLSWDSDGEQKLNSQRQDLTALVRPAIAKNPVWQNQAGRKRNVDYSRPRLFERPMPTSASHAPGWRSLFRLPPGS